MNKMNQPVCVVIGTSNRAGWNIARNYASRGFKIAFIGWSRRGLDFFKERADNTGFKSDAFFLEDAKNGTLERSLRKVRKELGHIDVMVYNETIWSPNFREFTQENSVWGDLRVNEGWAYTAINEVYSYMRDYRRGRIYFTTQEFSPRFRGNDRRFRSSQENFRRIAYDMRRNGIWFTFTTPSFDQYGDYNNSNGWNRNQNFDYNQNAYGYGNYGYDMSPRDMEYRNGWMNQWNSRYPETERFGYGQGYGYNNFNSPSYYGAPSFDYNYGYAQRGPWMNQWNDFRWDGQYANQWYDQRNYQSWNPSFNNNGNGNWNNDFGFDTGFDGGFDYADSYNDFGYGNESFESAYNEQSRNPQNV